MSKFRTTAVTSQSQAAIVVVVLVTTAGAMLSPSPLIILACGLCLTFIMRLLWSQDEPPILLLPAIFQWSEVATTPLSTIWKQVPLNQLSPYDADLNSGALFGLAAVSVLAAGLRWGSGRSKQAPFSRRLRAEAMAWSYRDVTVVSLSAVAAGYLAAFMAGSAGPARELFNEFSNVKYVGLFALTYWCLIRKNRLLLLSAVVAFEVVFGMTGFFADFKNSILTFLIAAVVARPKLRPAHLASVGAALTLLLVVAIFWSEIKPAYRAFVNQGTGGQVVLEPISNRLNFLADELKTMNGERFSHGFDLLVARHGYIEFLSVTMRNVPEGTPYENGQLTLAVLKHISIPRFLFPDKPVLPSDTAITARYTGLPMGISDSTSISIGYLGELYVDFGLFGALLAVGAMGALTGLAYRYLRDSGGKPVLLVGGLCLMVVLPLAYFGQAYSKTVGAAVFSTAVALVARRYWLPFVLTKQLKGPTPARLRRHLPIAAGMERSV